MIYNAIVESMHGKTLAFPIDADSQKEATLKALTESWDNADFAADTNEIIHIECYERVAKQESLF